jgi:hypothetical protein
MAIERIIEKRSVTRDGRHPLRGFIVRFAAVPRVRGLTRGYTPPPFQGCDDSGPAALKMMLLQVTPPSAF